MLALKFARGSQLYAEDHSLLTGVQFLVWSGINSVLAGNAVQLVEATVTEADGRRRSLDMEAVSTYDAAHLYLVHATRQPALKWPIPTMTTVFEVVANGKGVPRLRESAAALDCRTAARAEGAEGNAVLGTPNLGVRPLGDDAKISTKADIDDNWTFSKSVNC